MKSLDIIDIIALFLSLLLLVVHVLYEFLVTLGLIFGGGGGRDFLRGAASRGHDALDPKRRIQAISNRLQFGYLLRPEV